MDRQNTLLRALPYTLLCALMLIASLLAGTDSDKNYIVNGGFEPAHPPGFGPRMMGVPGMFPGAESQSQLFGPEVEQTWRRAWRPEKAVDLQMEFDNTEAHTGGHSARISCAELKELVCNNWVQRIDNFPKGVPLQLLGWVKTKDVEKDTVVVCVQCWDKGENMVGFGTTQKNYSFQGTTDWQQVSAELFVPENTQTMYVRCVLAGKGTAWFDDISLRIVSPMRDVSPDTILLPQPGKEAASAAAAPPSPQSPFAQYIAQKDEFMQKLEEIKSLCQREDPECRVALTVTVQQGKGLVLAGEVSFTPLWKIRDLNWAWSYVDVTCLPDRRSREIEEQLRQVIEEVEAEYGKAEPQLVSELKPVLNTTWAGCGSFRVEGKVSQPELLKTLDTRLRQKDLLRYIIYGSTHWGLTNAGFVQLVSP